MRFLLAFLFFSAAQFQVSLASKPVRVSAQPVKATISSPISSTKKLTSFEEATAFSKDLMERHHENMPTGSNRATSTLLTFSNLSQDSFQLVEIPPKEFEAFLHFKYQSVFIFLYPKHAFW